MLFVKSNLHDVSTISFRVLLPCQSKQNRFENSLISANLEQTLVLSNLIFKLGMFTHRAVIRNSDLQE